MVMFEPPKPGAAANVSVETHAATDLVIAWGLKRWPTARVIRELALGDRRVDVVFVMEADIAGVEIKGPKDSLDRLGAQLREYAYWLPMVFAAIDSRFKEQVRGIWIPNLMWLEGGSVMPSPYLDPPTRDDLCCSRLLDLLWRDEAAAIALRTGVIPGRIPSKFNKSKILSMLARLLTGHEIVKQVCTELRARQLVGMGSSAPMRTDFPIKTGAPPLIPVTGKPIKEATGKNRAK